MSAFPETRWSLLVRTQDGSVTVSREALGDLLRLYSPALKAHLIYRRGLQPSDADDVLQEFISEKILERDLLRSADREKGRLRSLLVRSLTNFLIDELRRRKTLGRAVQLDDELVAKPVSDESDVLEVMWARQVLLEALQRMRQYCFDSGQQTIWSVFVMRVIQPAVSGEEVSYAEIVERCGMKDAAQASNRLMSAKRQFDRILGVVISEYAEGPSSVEEEKKHFQNVLANSRVLQAKEFAELTGDVSANASRELTSVVAAEPAQLSLLIGSSDPQNWTDEDLARFLETQLALPLGDVIATAVDSEMCVIDALESRDVRHEWLTELQRFSQGLVHGEHAESPREVGAVLYFASVAAALVRHGQSTSEISAASLATGMQAFVGRAWVPESIRCLLREAGDQLS